MRWAIALSMLEGFSMRVSSASAAGTGLAGAGVGPFGAAVCGAMPSAPTLPISFSTSILTMRPSGPEPLPASTRRSMTFSLASLRAIGLARSSEAAGALAAGAAEAAAGTSPAGVAASVGAAAGAAASISAGTSSPASPVTAIGAPSSASAPSGTRILRRTPSS